MRKTTDTMVKETVEVDWDLLLAQKTVTELVTTDRRAECDCPMPYVHRKWHKALGVFTEIRLCCIARIIEEKLGLLTGSLYKHVDFEPTAEWDCEQALDDGKGGKTPRGAPPKWLKQRFDKKGIKVKNLNVKTKKWGEKS